MSLLWNHPMAAVLCALAIAWVAWATIRSEDGDDY